MLVQSASSQWGMSKRAVAPLVSLQSQVGDNSASCILVSPLPKSSLWHSSGRTLA